MSCRVNEDILMTKMNRVIPSKWVSLIQINKLKMKQTEMQNLVDSLAQKRKHHLEAIEKITIKDLKEMVGNISI